MRAELIRFCNNPACERCDEYLRPWEVLRSGAQEVCPACHEELVVRESRPRWLGRTPSRAASEPRRE